MLIFPINRVPDEMNHARMTWEILHEPTDRTVKWMDIVTSTPAVKPNEYVKLFTDKLDMSQEKHRLSLGLKNLSFLPQLLGMSLGELLYPSIGVIIFLGRFFNAMAYLLGIYFLLSYFKYGKKVLFFLSLLPIMVQQAASLSYDVMNYLEIMWAVGFLTRLAYFKKFGKAQLLEVSLIAVGLLATKPNNVLLLSLIPFILFEFTGVLSVLNRPIEACKKLIRSHVGLFLALAMVLSIAICWLLMRNHGGLSHYFQVLVNTLFNNRLNPDLNSILTIGLFAYLGNFTIQLPLWLIFIDIIALVYLSFQEGESFTKSYRWMSFLLFCIQVLAVITVMYLQWTPIVLGADANISVGAQGRYFTPFLILLFPIVSGLAKPALSQKRQMLYATSLLTLNFLVSLYLVIPYYWNLWG